jgi:hypothetical protein
VGVSAETSSVRWVDDVQAVDMISIGFER